MLPLLCSALLSCNSLDIPPAPDLQPILEAYANPTAAVTQEIMARVADTIADSRKGLDDSGFYEELLDVLIRIQEELDALTDERGNVTLEGVGTFPSPSGFVDIDFICTGWRDTEPNDPANGSLKLTMTLGGGRIRPLVWGTATECRYLKATNGELFEVSYDGDFAAHFGGLVSTEQSLRERLVTYVLKGTIGIGGVEFDIDQSFRVAEDGRLDILVRLEDGNTFIYFFNNDRSIQGFDDATGRFGCSLEERQCRTESGASFSW